MKCISNTIQCLIFFQRAQKGKKFFSIHNLQPLRFIKSLPKSRNERNNIFVTHRKIGVSHPNTPTYKSAADQRYLHTLCPITSSTPSSLSAINVWPQLLTPSHDRCHIFHFTSVLRHDSPRAMQVLEPFQIEDDGIWRAKRNVAENEHLWLIR